MNMIITSIQEQEYDIAVLIIEVAVFYGTEDIPNNFPGRNDDLLKLIIDINSGQILNWDKDFGEKTGGWNLNMKVCDGGCYYLIDVNDVIVDSLENDYVPSRFGIGSDDYIQMDIDHNGKILGWEKNFTARNGFNHNA